MVELEKLRFGHGNAKLDEAIFTFSLPAGHTCPFAKQCLAKADKQTGRLRDGKDVVFRCYSASAESLYSNVRQNRWHNFNLLKGLSKKAIINLILNSLSPLAGYVRCHIAGDFYSQDYFDAWLAVANARPRTIFYAYTKALPFWVKRLRRIPKNFILTASYGGTHDHLIEKYNLRYAKVVFSQAEAKSEGLPIDHDDSHAYNNGGSFALLLHGVQPAGSVAAKAVSTIRRNLK